MAQKLDFKVQRDSDENNDDNETRLRYMQSLSSNDEVSNWGLDDEKYSQESEMYDNSQEYKGQNIEEFNEIINNDKETSRKITEETDEVKKIEGSSLERSFQQTNLESTLEEGLEDKSKVETKEVRNSVTSSTPNIGILEILVNLDLQAKEIFLNFIEDQQLLELRLVCKQFNVYVDSYIRHSLTTCHFFTVQSTRLPMDFWFAAMRFFYLEAGRVYPLNRIRYHPIVAALKHNHKILPVSSEQMRAHVVVTLDKLRPEHIVFCNHVHPQPHTCDVNLEIKGPSKVFFDDISIIQFVQHYFDQLQIVDDEIIRGNRPFTKHRLACYFYHLLKSIKMLCDKDKGTFKTSRIEYLVNTGTIMRHRIWYQLYASWGSMKKTKISDKNTVKSKSDTVTKELNSRSVTNLKINKVERLMTNQNTYRSSYNVKSRSNIVMGAENTRSSIDDSDNGSRDELKVEIFLTVADHFQWDS
ncbi:hypothetical protein cand_014630 [Cryptosporidium andersoni]|uniref:F-box domain-containing protein n=1 Tax=Cryptosporidium andersoni TaxID=117008 RepID=A0A1J4MU93_9CRYT|nr:hypothetical protein cand_014630 [Cryptosporidium andersoni]